MISSTDTYYMCFLYCKYAALSAGFQCKRLKTTLLLIERWIWKKNRQIRYFFLYYVYGDWLKWFFCIKKKIWQLFIVTKEQLAFNRQSLVQVHKACYFNPIAITVLNFFDMKIKRKKKSLISTNKKKKTLLPSNKYD